MLEEVHIPVKYAAQILVIFESQTEEGAFEEGEAFWENPGNPAVLMGRPRKACNSPPLAVVLSQQTPSLPTPFCIAEPTQTRGRASLGESARPLFLHFFLKMVPN